MQANERAKVEGRGGARATWSATSDYSTSVRSPSLSSPSCLAEKARDSLEVFFPCDGLTLPALAASTGRAEETRPDNARPGGVADKVEGVAGPPGGLVQSRTLEISADEVDDDEHRGREKGEQVEQCLGGQVEERASTNKSEYRGKRKLTGV